MSNGEELENNLEFISYINQIVAANNYIIPEDIVGVDARVKYIFDNFGIDLRAEFDRFRTNISQKIASMDMSGSGSGEVLLNRLDDVDDTDKANGKVLKFNSTTGKLEYESDTLGDADLGDLT